MTYVVLAKEPRLNLALNPQFVEVAMVQATRQSDKDHSLFSKPVAIVMAWVPSSETLACNILETFNLTFRTCRGKGSVYNSVKETINVPKGVDNNVNLRVSKKGNFSATGPPGDLLVTIKVRPDPYFKRDGSDIHTEYFLTVS